MLQALDLGIIQSFKIHYSICNMATLTGLVILAMSILTFRITLVQSQLTYDEDILWKGRDILFSPNYKPQGPEILSVNSLREQMSANSQSQPRSSRGTLITTILSLFILSGDIEINPGPNDWWLHSACEHVVTETYHALGNCEDSWYCAQCCLPPLSDSFFGSPSVSHHNARLASDDDDDLDSLSLGDVARRHKTYLFCHLKVRSLNQFLMRSTITLLPSELASCSYPLVRRDWTLIFLME